MRMLVGVVDFSNRVVLFCPSRLESGGMLRPSQNVIEAFGKVDKRIELSWTESTRTESDMRRPPSRGEKKNRKKTEGALSILS